MNEREFNDLLTDDWIPCYEANTIRLYGIRSALENANTIQSIECESPPVRIAVLRLLLAFCYRVAWANDTPVSSFRNWKRLHDEWAAGIPAQWIDRYLDRCNCRDRFRLFDAEYPFFQVAGLEYKGNGQPESATRLFFEQFAGIPNSLWEHNSRLPSLQEAALYLVTCQAFGASTSNTSKVKVGNLEYSPTGRTFAPAYTGCIVWLEGKNLLETLMLNLVDYDLTDTDLPIWEKPLNIHILRARQPQKAEEGDLDKDGRQIRIGKKLGDYRETPSTGPVQLFTWPSRAVLLTKPENGQVKTVYFTQGLKLSDRSADPMKPYNSEGEPIPLQRHKAAWRDLYSLLSIQPNRNRTVLALSHAARSGITGAKLNIAGIARGDEVAKILFWRHERMPVSVAMLADINLIERLGKLLAEAENIAGESQEKPGELYRRTQRIAKLYLSPDAESPGGRQPDRGEVAKIVEAIDPRPAFWARLEEHFFALLESLSDDWDTASGDWKPEVQQTATRAWREHVKSEAQRALEESIRSLGTTTRVIQAVARVRTDFDDSDLKPLLQKIDKTGGKGKGGKRK